MTYDHIGGFIALALGFLLLYVEYRARSLHLWDWFHELNMIPCKCGCKDDHWNIKANDGGFVSEAEIVCDNCGTVVNYWAYGSTQYPETYTGLIKKFFYDIKVAFKVTFTWIFRG